MLKRVNIFNVLKRGLKASLKGKKIVATDNLSIAECSYPLLALHALLIMASRHDL